MHTAGASPARGPPRSPTRSRDATPLTSAGTAAASGFESPLAQHLYNGFLVGSLSDVRVRAFDRVSALRDPALKFRRRLQSPPARPGPVPLLRDGAERRLARGRRHGRRGGSSADRARLRRQLLARRVRALSRPALRLAAPGARPAAVGDGRALARLRSVRRRCECRGGCGGLAVVRDGGGSAGDAGVPAQPRGDGDVSRSAGAP